jgi:hypothetical protein
LWDGTGAVEKEYNNFLVHAVTDINGPVRLIRRLVPPRIAGRNFESLRGPAITIFYCQLVSPHYDRESMTDIRVPVGRFSRRQYRSPDQGVISLTDDFFFHLWNSQIVKPPQDAAGTQRTISLSRSLRPYGVLWRFDVPILVVLI